MRPRDQFVRVKGHLADGLNDVEVSRITGIPRTTVRDWRRTPLVLRHESKDERCPICGCADLNEKAYSYLLGMYLGDGCLSLGPRAVYRLRITLDKRYRAVIAECASSIRLVRPDGVVGFVDRPGCIDVVSYWKHWPCLFPQHGPGPKHMRRILLAKWQQSIVAEDPENLLRGLIHSDGCRTLNVVTRRAERYSYPRYMFTNTSPDIRYIFTTACEAVGVRWRAMNSKTVSIARQADVAILDSFIGPKR